MADLLLGDSNVVDVLGRGEELRLRKNSPDSRLVLVLLSLLLLLVVNVLVRFRELEDQALPFLEVGGGVDGGEVLLLPQELDGDGGRAEEVLLGVPAHRVLRNDVLLDALPDDKVVELTADDAVGGDQVLKRRHKVLETLSAVVAKW